jgi:hypothetical protein
MIDASHLPQEKPMIHAILGRLAAALRIAIPLAMLLFGSAALAAQEDPEDPPGNDTMSSQSAETATGQAESDAPTAARDAEPAAEPQPPAAADSPAPGKPTPDVFVPTEEISEDYAVSFPVDI